MMAFVFLLIALTVAVLGGTWYTYRIAFFSPKEGRDQVRKIKDPQYDPYRPEMARIYNQLKDRPFERVYITTFDGLTLSGRYYHVLDGAPLDLCFHGYRSHPLTDFSGGSELSFLSEHNLLLVDQRSHGQSQGRTITFGIKERQDLLFWLDYAIGRFGEDVKILLYGVSMGGATVLMASELPLPNNVRGIIADCPFSSPVDVILHVGKKNPLPGWLIRPFAILAARIFGGFDLRETTAEKAVKSTPVPILILHGKSDTYVPCQMSDIVHANPKMVTRHVFPGAAHGISYLADTPRYHRLVREFTEKLLTP